MLSFGSPGIGTPPYLAGALFRRMAGIDMQLPQVKAGLLRPLAVTGPRRVASLADVPTMAEAGLPGYEFEG